MHNQLWMPESAKDALCIDSEEIETSSDLSKSLFVNLAIVDWLNGKLDYGTLLDIFLEFDIDPSRIDQLQALINR